MTKLQRLKSVLMGLIMMTGGFIFLFFPVKSYPFITFLLFCGLLINGIYLLHYYFTMARYMVDGKNVLYEAVIMIDFGLFTGSLTRVPLIYVMLYLIAIHIFAGVVLMLRAFESKQLGSAWRFTMAHGVFNILIALLCLSFIHNTELAVSIYALGVISSGAMLIATAFRKTSMIYIQ